MNDDELEDRVRADLRAAAGRPVPDALAGRAASIAREERRAPARRWWPRAVGGVAVAGGAIVVAAVVASLLPPRSAPAESTSSPATSAGSPAPSGGPPATSPASAEAATAPGPSPAASAAVRAGLFVWRPLDAAQLGGAGLDAVVARPDGSLLGLGRSPLIASSAGPGWSTTVWQSTDGAAWGRVPGTAAFTAVTPGWNAVALAAARTPSGYVAVGMDQQPDASGASASAWFSADGVRWTRATVADPTGRTMDEIVVTGSGLVALGEAGYSFHPGMGFGTAIWTSADGRSWSRVPAADAPPPGTRLTAAVAAPGGGYLAAASQEYMGATTEPVRPLTAGIWRSADAVHWAPVAGSPLGAASIAVRGSTVVAVGSGGRDLSQPALAWRSEDGTAWPGGPLPTPPGLPPGVGLGASLVVDGTTGMLAIGGRTDGADSSSLVAWSTPDGASWTADSLPAPLATAIYRAFPLRGAVLVAGEAQPDTGPVAVMWLVTPALPRPPITGTSQGPSDPGTAGASDVPASAPGESPAAASSHPGPPPDTGACSASQLAAGEPVSSYAFGPQGVTIAFLSVRLVDTGGGCVLVLPSSIEVSGADGADRTVGVNRPDPSAPVRVGRGESVTLLLSASWPAGPPSSRAAGCGAGIADVGRVAVNIGGSPLDLVVPVPWLQVCPSPPNVSLSVAAP